MTKSLISVTCGFGFSPPATLGSNKVKLLMTQVWMVDVLPKTSQVYFGVASHLSLTRLDVFVISFTLLLHYLHILLQTQLVNSHLSSPYFHRQIMLEKELSNIANTFKFLCKQTAFGRNYIYFSGSVAEAFQLARRYKKQWKKIWTSWTYYLICLINFSCCYVVLFWIKILLILTTERPKLVSSFFKGYSVRYGSDLTVLLYK